jgi:hypothetical protein
MSKRIENKRISKIKIAGLRPVYKKIKGAKLIFVVEIIFFRSKTQKKIEKKNKTPLTRGEINAKNIIFTY